MEAQKKELATTSQTSSSTIDNVFGDFSSHGSISQPPPPPATSQGLQTTEGEGAGVMSGWFVQVDLLTLKVHLVATHPQSQHQVLGVTGLYNMLSHPLLSQILVTLQLSRMRILLSLQDRWPLLHPSPPRSL